MARLRIVVVVASALALLGAVRQLHGPRAQAASAVTPAQRGAGLSFASGVAPGDQAWIRAAEAKARPEAARLLDEVDGLTRIGTFSAPGDGIVGYARPIGAHRYEVQFNLAYLDGRRTSDRDQAVLHELGHVVDFALVDDAERDRLAAQVPDSGVCYEARYGDCAPAAERFADTFAKWALRGAVSAVGAGYSLSGPASLEDWGAPLAALAVRLDVAARER